MKIVHPKNINFSIGSDGSITRTGIWRVKPDEEVNILENRPGFRQEVEDWAGKIGDPFRAPTADLQGYTEDPDYLELSRICGEKYGKNSNFAGVLTIKKIPFFKHKPGQAARKDGIHVKIIISKIKTQVLQSKTSRNFRASCP